MVTYIYFVKCPNCEDEHFDFFDDAKGFAMGCLSKKPIITQTEVCRNDFGECTDSSDLGTVWSWEDECKDCQEPVAEPTFTKDEITADYEPDTDPEFVDDDSDFRFVNDMTESLNGADLDEIKKLCDEIGIITMYDLHSFMKETGATDDTLVAKLREYRDELGPDFKIKESCKKDISEGWWYEDTHYEVGKGITKEELYDVLVNQNKTAMVNLGDCGETEVFFSDYSRYSDSELEIEWEGDDVFSIYEWFNSDDGDRTDGDYAFTANSFEELWAELCIMAPSFFADNTRKPVPEGMTIEQLVEEMEENEDEVECTWCNDLFHKDQCRKEVNLGWLCSRCADGIMSRGETLTFKENNYWDFLDEKFDIDFEDEASTDRLDYESDLFMDFPDVSDYTEEDEEV